jgi:CubicO group peptidase (beta-lactamase class C family)
MQRFLVTCLAFLLITAQPVAARPAHQEPRLSPNQIARIERVVQQAMKAHGAPGASIAVGLGGKVVWAQGFGFADLESRTPAGAQTAYRSASIGKSMTATAAFMLKEAGKLDLDVPVQSYCPRFPVKAWPVTSRHLLSHTSGVRHYEGPHIEAELFNQIPFTHYSDAVSIFAGDPLKHEPGTEFTYSTWGYVLLGCVLEGASGTDFATLMRTSIFEPAGMTSTRPDDPRAIVPNRARGYIFEEGQLRVSRWVDMSSKMAAGGWLTTAPDLVRFANAWMAGAYVNADNQRVMLSPFRLNNGDTIDQYGMGFFVDDYHGLRAALHGGGTPGVTAILFFVPERGMSVACFFNLEDIPGPARIRMAEEIADIVLGYTEPNPDHFTPPPPPPPPH